MVDISQWRAVIGQWNNRCSTCRGSTNTVKSSSNVCDSTDGGMGPTVSVMVLAVILVMLSGDVELNPGPVPDVTLEAVHDLLVSQASKWNEIGLALKVPRDFRKGLQQQDSSNMLKLEDVIDKWIESHCSEVSWDHLITVLRGEQLEMVAVAKTVEDYGIKRFKPSTSPKSSHHPTVVPLQAVQQHEASSSTTQPSTHEIERYRHDHRLSGFTSLPTAKSSISTAHMHSINELPTSMHPTICQSGGPSTVVLPTQISVVKPISTISYDQEQCRFEKTLKGLYKRKSPSYSKKPSPFLKYINLLLVQPKKGKSTMDKKASTLDKKSLMRYKMIGDTKMLSEESSCKKHSIKIDEICESPHIDKKSCPCLVLIKGDPGVGKTTLAWELCVRWAEGSLLQKWKFVKFIQLRAKEVREAKTVESLLDPYNEHGEFCNYIMNLGGEGMLLIFDGFDELSQEQLKESSLFMRLLEGKTFSKASIIVTSRPSAVQLIPEIFMNNLEQFIEVVGFAKEDISNYIECKFEDNKEALDAFNSYISSHEFIFTLMYVPLHCALITDLYEEYQRDKMEFEPKTLTQLYTCFIHCLIQRNTGLRVVHDLSELPQDLKDKFKELAIVLQLEELKVGSMCLIMN